MLPQELIENLNLRLLRLAVFQPKGGVGKTGISLNLALTFGYSIITNDRYSIIDQVLEEGYYHILQKDEKLPKVDKDAPVIFDFGGYLDSRIIAALKQSQFILVPILAYEENLQTALDFIAEVQTHNKNIIMIVNRTVKGEFEAIKEAVNRYYLEIPVFEVKQSKGMSNMIKRKMSIQDLVDESKQQHRFYHKLAKQFMEIAEYMYSQHREQ